MVEKLGFTTLTQRDSQQSGNMGLGGYDVGVTTEEMAAAYAAIANDGYARGIRPVHTSADGDSIFVMASGEVEVGFDAVAALACECMARAINRSASEAKPAYGLLSAQSFR